MIMRRQRFQLLLLATKLHVPRPGRVCQFEITVDGVACGDASMSGK
jgi:hypothetical protein